MQHVEKGKVGLDDDLRKVIPRLSNIEVLKGFDDDGKPNMEKDRKPITLRESSRAYLVISRLTKLQSSSNPFQRYRL